MTKTTTDFIIASMFGLALVSLMAGCGHQSPELDSLSDETSKVCEKNEVYNYTTNQCTNPDNHP